MLTWLHHNYRIRATQAGSLIILNKYKGQGIFPAPCACIYPIYLLMGLETPALYPAFGGLWRRAHASPAIESPTRRRPFFRGWGRYDQSIYILSEEKHLLLSVRFGALGPRILWHVYCGKAVFIYVREKGLIRVYRRKKTGAAKTMAPGGGPAGTCTSLSSITSFTSFLRAAPLSIITLGGPRFVILNIPGGYDQFVSKFLINCYDTIFLQA